MKFFLIYFFLPAFIHAQSEVLLKKSLEGRRVEVLIEMPAYKDGIDLEIYKDQPIDFDEYGERITKHGIAIYPGDIVMITRIKKKNYHLEFQLAGGGFGTFGDPFPYVARQYVPKSEREEQLEELLDANPDKENKERWEKELKSLQHERKKEQERLDSEKALIEERKKMEIAQLKLSSGSRFNIRFNRKVTEEDLTEENLMQWLEDYVNFQPSGERQYDEAPLAIKKGLLWSDISSLLGSPVSMMTKSDCGLEVKEYIFVKGGNRYLITLVENVVVKYSIHSE